MARYYYKKYSAIEQRTNYRNHHLVNQFDMSVSDMMGYEGFGYTSENGYYTTGAYKSVYGSVVYVVYWSGALNLYAYKSGAPGDMIVTVFYYELDYDATYSRGSYIEEVVAEDGTYPNDGYYNGYWYVKDRLAFPELILKIEGTLKTSEQGWVKVDGALKEIDRMWIKIDGALKEL